MFQNSVKFFGENSNGKLGGLKSYEYPDFQMSAVHTVDNREDGCLLDGYDSEIAAIMRSFPPSIQVKMTLK